MCAQYAAEGTNSNTIDRRTTNDFYSSRAEERKGNRRRRRRRHSSLSLSPKKEAIAPDFDFLIRCIFLSIEFYCGEKNDVFEKRH